ncbi:MAG: SRPBCC domain-containing protein [Desulfobacterales bacterium]
MIIRREIDVQAPLDVVWRVFSRMEDWREWNPVCRNCCYLEGSEMALDTCFAFDVAPLFVPLRVTPRITRCEPGREVIWEGGRFGVNAEHIFRFDEREGRVRILSVERFKGPLLPVGRLLGIPRRLHRLAEAFLLAIKQQAEACVK